MIDYPKTLEEARRFRYGCWGGDPVGRDYEEGYCAEEVWPADGIGSSYQCMRKNGHGINGLYCKQHAKTIEKRG